MRSVAIVIRTASTVVFAAALLYYPLVFMGSLFCALDDSAYETVWITAIWGSPILVGAGLLGAWLFYRRGKFLGAITCSIIPWFSIIAFLLLQSQPHTCV